MDAEKLDPPNRSVVSTRWIRVRVALGLAESLPADKPLRTKNRLLLFLGGCAMPVLAWFLARTPDLVEHWYSERAGQLTLRAFTLVSGIFPFSIAEVTLICLLLWILWLAARGVMQVAGRRRHFFNAAVCGILWLAGLAGILLLGFYLVWGFNFARPDWVARQGWSSHAAQPAADAAEAELMRYCTQAVDLANREFAVAIGSGDPGSPSKSLSSMNAMDVAIEEGYARVATSLNLHPSIAADRGRAKPVLASFVMSAMLIGGFFSPWTGEANYNTDLPPCDIPQSIAHEKAHQRCVTNEDEANFLGFLACIYSGDPYVRYSGYLFAQRQLLGELRRFAPDEVPKFVARCYPGIQRDIDFDRKFVESHRGLLSDLNMAAIDAYLKANRVRAGMRSYSLSARLIIIYARIQGLPKS
jgi:hypothetical protein